MGSDSARLRRLLDNSVATGRRLARTPAPAGVRTGLRERLGLAEAHADSRPPPHTARITVVPHHDRHGGPQAFGVSAWCEGVPRLPYTTGPTQLRPTDIGLGNALGDGPAPSQLLRDIRHWSGNQRRLGAWINRARAVHGDALQITIHDDTGYEIPWEAFWLPADPENGLGEGLLGALVAVTRWLTIRSADMVLPESSVCAAGDVLGYYFHDVNVAPGWHGGARRIHDMRDDMAVFHGYAHRPHVTIDGFLDELDARPSDPVGLVYMAAHGTYDERVNALTLAEVSWAEYDDRPMTVLDKDHSMVCLNACHSARFVRNTGVGETDLRGFTELFLRKGAGGCVVAAGQVGDSEARELIGQLVGIVAEEPWRPVADSLRLFRARALHEFGPLAQLPRALHEGRPNVDGQRPVLRLLYSLMFQYYGHPLSTLSLSGPRGDRTRDREGAHGER
ncbi:CHAT domain-containing protein [Streptomyces sp. NPDC048473]|uniref:CHAT domain-containing protein n=1 Tax=unclassified Streptomyces TaxID=2593676 RepID=UPI003710884D